MNPKRYLPRSLPPALKGLTDLTLDLRWNWNHSTNLLWRTVDPELWAATGDPWRILESISRKWLETLAADASFVNEFLCQFAYRKAYLSQSSWFDELYGEDSVFPRIGVRRQYLCKCPWQVTTMANLSASLV